MVVRMMVLLLIVVVGCDAPQPPPAPPREFPAEGDMLPELRVITLEGETITNSDLKGKIVLINFFATWCSPCIAEMKHLEPNTWERFREQDFMLLAIGQHGNSELVKFRKQLNVTFPMAGDPNATVFNRFHVNNIPQSFLVDRDGRILLVMRGVSQRGLDQMNRKIESALEQRTE